MSEQDKSSAKQASNSNENDNLDGDISSDKIADNAINSSDANADTVSDASADNNSDASADNSSDPSADNNSDTNAENAAIQDQYEYAISDDNIQHTENDKAENISSDNIDNTKDNNAENISSDNIDHTKDNNTENISDDKSDDKAEKNDVAPNAKTSAKSRAATIKKPTSIQKKQNTSPSSTEEIDPDLPHAKPMTLMQHLGELRNKIVRSAIAVSLSFVVCYSFADIIFSELIRPLTKVLPEDSKLIFTSLPEAFFLELQIGFVAAIFLSSPFLFYQIWSFIAPGLYDEEKKYAIPIAIISALFFICGAAFCYFIVFPFSFEYFMSFATDDIIPMPSISQYFGFTLKILIAFGLIFEMPLFTFFLSRMGLVTATAMRNVRKYSVLAIFIIAAILTPPDVISQLLMAIPMILLYEISIYIAVIFGKKPKNKKDDDKKSDDKKDNDKKDDDKNVDDKKDGDKNIDDKNDNNETK